MRRWEGVEGSPEGMQETSRRYRGCPAGLLTIDGFLERHRQCTR